jgi:hypothetical protein
MASRLPAFNRKRRVAVVSAYLPFPMMDGRDGFGLLLLPKSLG